ncbi:MAG: carboxypeptidase-like regulatory domain-containing protein [Nanoarchaeota archaeon]
MGIKSGAIVLVLFCFIVLLGCFNESESLTGGTVVEQEVSTMTVLVQDEDGLPIPEARVYLDGEYKGKTSEYGKSKGTRTVILRSEKHTILAEKEGYFTSNAKTVSANFKGAQYLTVVLESKKTSVEVEVFAEGKRVQNAVVSLEGSEGTERAAKTDKQGIASFKRLPDGKYSLTIRKEGYELKKSELSVEYDRDGLTTKQSVVLSPIRQLVVEVVDGETWIPLENVEISLYLAEEYNSPGSVAEHVKFTSMNGIVQFEKASFGEDYVLVLKKTGYNAKTVAWNMRTDTSRQQIELEKE